MRLWALISVALAIVSLVSSQGPPVDQILFLPGLAEQPSFKQYSGFLSAGATRKMFYWFVASQGTPEKDPLLLWLDAGPGCSSMVTMFKEHGPFRVADNGKSLVENAYSWNKLANVLYLEAPASVGFSYDLAGNYTSNDDSTVDDIQSALTDFFNKFSSLKENDFYLSGKGSAATYVTILASRLLEDPKGIKLKGYAIGNGALDFPSNGNSLLLFGQYHGILDPVTWNQLLSSCCNGSASEETCSFVEPPFISVECETAVEIAAHLIIERGLNNNDLYDKCVGFHPNQESGSKMERAMQYATFITPHLRAQQLVLRSLNVKAWRPNNLQSNPPCVTYDDVATYLNQPQVRKALHSADSPMLWTPCSDRLLYATQYITLGDVVKKLIDSGKLKSLFYNGDTDLTFNVVGNQMFVDSLGYEVLSEYKPWKLRDQVAGYYQAYKGNVTFVTIKGAGHLAAQNKAEEALDVISRLFKSEAL
ncbi:lysosomal protective protein [Rhipicephalus microplus]|uniref:lysosomal protective protein n=1 Tax=Rhipicephalus microplus TaxID=6941 RepID=UPI003F6C7E5C